MLLGQRLDPLRLDRSEDYSRWLRMLPFGQVRERQRRALEDSASAAELFWLRAYHLEHKLSAMRSDCDPSPDQTARFVRDWIHVQLKEVDPSRHSQNERIWRDRGRAMAHTDSVGLQSLSERAIRHPTDTSLRAAHRYLERFIYL